jgi:hypothetical protein
MSSSTMSQDLRAELAPTGTLQVGINMSNFLLVSDRTSYGREAGAAFLRDFVEAAKSSGLVAQLIERHKVRGLSVAPPG